MARFKVGDKVKVIRQSPSSQAAGKRNYIGNVYIIKKLHEGENPWKYELDGISYLWADNELELVGFSKADLRDGMVVEYRNGTRSVVLNDRFMLSTKFNRISSYTDDLLCEPNSFCDLSEYDVIKIYETDGNTLDSLFDDRYLELIWERPEEETHKEMTVEEIEKELGYKIKVVGGQNG